MEGTFVHDQAKHLMAAGCEVKVLVPTAYCPKIMMNVNRWSKYAHVPECDTIDGVPVYYPRYLRLPGKWFHALACYTQYLGLKNIAHAIIKEFKPDIIHAHAATEAGFVGLILKQKYGLPLICSITGSDINSYPRYGKFSMQLTKKVLTGSDRIVSVSAALKNAAKAIARPKQEISVVYDGCEHNVFVADKENRRHVRNDLGISETDKVLIFVGDLLRGKGILDLIDAFRRAQSGKSNMHLIVIGGNLNRNDSEVISVLNGINGSIHMPGKLPHHEIPRYLNAADIFVFPSYSEGLPNAVLEAMACSLPVIATRVGGIPEAVEDEKSGILIEKKDVSSLVRSIEYLVSNEAIAKQMGIHGRRTIESKFSWKNNAKKLSEIYEGVIL